MTITAIAFEGDTDLRPINKTVYRNLSDMVIRARAIELLTRDALDSGECNIYRNTEKIGVFVKVDGDIFRELQVPGEESFYFTDPEDATPFTEGYGRIP